MTTFDFTHVYHTVISRLNLTRSGYSYHSGRSGSSQNVSLDQPERFGFYHHDNSDGNAGYGIPSEEWFIVEKDNGFIAEVNADGTLRMSGEPEGKRMSEDEMIATIVTAYRAEGLRRGQAAKRRPRRLAKKLTKLTAELG